MFVEVDERLYHLAKRTPLSGPSHSGRMRKKQESRLLLHGNHFLRKFLRAKRRGLRLNRRNSEGELISYHPSIAHDAIDPSVVKFEARR